MIVLVVLLWLMSLIVIVTNPWNEKIRWATYIGFCGGFGGFGVVLGKDDFTRPDWILWMDGISTSIGHYFTPYTILVFGLLYSDILKTHNQKILSKVLALIPILIMYLIYQVYPEFRTNHAVLAIWVVPYVLIANILLVYSAIRETRLIVKRQKVLTCIAIVPVVTFALVTNIILEAFGIVGVWKYNPYVIAIQFIFFLHFSVKYGWMGVQIRIEKVIRDSTMKAVTSGTSLFNHTIKNEIAKIDFLMYQLKESKSLGKDESKKIDLVLSSTSHVLNLSKRIQNKLDVIELKESWFWINEIIDSALDMLQIELNPDIAVIREYEIYVKVCGDSVHIRETVLNIVKNATEAMIDKGFLIIKIYLNRRLVHIDFTDNGQGIEKGNVSLVFDPFFSTKGRVGNFGLGLTYCFNVMQKHGGDIVMKSEVNKGTTVTLSLPNIRVVDIHKMIEK